MNLVEKLNTHIRNSEITLYNTYSDYAKSFIPIFAEFIKGIENPYEKVLKPIYRGQPYKPLNTDYFTFEAAREIILSELEKMKNE